MSDVNSRLVTALAIFFERLNAQMDAPAGATKAPAKAIEKPAAKAAETKPAATADNGAADGDKVRAVLADVMTQKGRDSVVSLLSAVGAKRLADVKPENYAQLLGQAERLLAGGGDDLI